MLRRYQALRMLAGMYKALAVLMMTASLIGGVALMVLPFFGSEAVNQFMLSYGLSGTSAAIAGIGGGLVALLVGFMSGLPLLAFGQLVDLLISLEENTRIVVHVIEDKADVEEIPIARMAQN